MTRCFFDRRLRLFVALAVLPLLGGWELLRSKNAAVESGNAAMKTGKAEDALAAYDKAAGELPTEPGVHYNRGAALSALKRHDEAALAFLRATDAKDPTLKQRAFYNLGNSFLGANKFAEAIEAYKRALQLSPSDARAKWNLEVALLRKKEEDKKKEEQKKDDKDKDQNKDGKQDGSKKDEPKQDDKKQDGSKKDEPKQDKAKDDPKQDENKQGEGKPDEKAQPEAPKPPESQQGNAEPKPAGDSKPGDPGAPSPDELREVDAVLDSLERSPKSLEKERARLRAVRRSPPAKDW